MCVCGNVLECSFFQLCACGEYVLLARREPLISGIDYISACHETKIHKQNNKVL